MSRASRYGGAGQSEAQRAWRLLVELEAQARGEWRRKVVEATGMPFSRARALWRLDRGPRSLAELAKDLGTDAPAATVLINTLEARGLVKREPHPTDRRTKQVSLTAAGLKMLAVIARITDQPPPALAALPQKELAALRQILEKLV